MSQITDRLFKLPEPPYFYRAFGADVPVDLRKVKDRDPYLEQAKQVTAYTLALLALYQPLAPLLEITGEAIRLYKDWSEYRTGERDIAFSPLPPAMSIAIDVASFIATCFIAYPLGSTINTSRQVLIYALRIKLCVQERYYYPAMVQSLHLINHSLYLAVLLGGGFPMTMASFASQVVIHACGIYTPSKQKKDISTTSPALSATASALLSLGRAYQGYNYYQLNRKIDFLPPHATPIEVQSGGSLTGRVKVAA